MMHVYNEAVYWDLIKLHYTVAHKALWRQMAHRILRAGEFILSSAILTKPSDPVKYFLSWTLIIGFQQPNSTANMKKTSPMDC